ncbi:intracellular ribonuclease LX-like [Juglans regia]|uniref:Intracellular ribonuclease LX-like n=1 Tax=Juglans regia TaxID=51240 RepID=A0A6P9EED6_JUGRE|nr:intracellular ribonuclease LX-like [Juglans regia]
MTGHITSSVKFTATVLGVGFLRSLIFIIQVLASSNVAEEFSYYKLALQWPNSVCNVGVPCSKKPDEIKTDYQRFLIHGLWPFWPNNSALAPCLGNELTSSQVKGIKDSLKKYWPNLLRPDDFSFWKYEWATHGRCLGLEPSVYFNDAIELRTRYNDYIGLNDKGCRPIPNPYKRITIYNALYEALGKKHGQLKCNMRNGGYQSKLGWSC